MGKTMTNDAIIEDTSRCMASFADRIGVPIVKTKSQIVREFAEARGIPVVEYKIT